MPSSRPVRDDLRGMRGLAALLILLGCVRLLSLCAGGITTMRLALGLGSIGVGLLCLELPGTSPQLPRARSRERR